MLRTLIALLSIATAVTASPFIIERRDAPLNNSFTYCGSKDKGDDQEYLIPCTKTSDPLSEVLGWLPYIGGPGRNVTNRFSAHYECAVEIPGIGDRYLAGHAYSGAEPCWVTASLLGPTSSCPDPPTPDARCTCDRNQLASCCAFRAAGSDFNGYINSTYVYCPA